MFTHESENVPYVVYPNFKCRMEQKEASWNWSKTIKCVYDCKSGNISAR